MAPCVTIALYLRFTTVAIFSKSLCGYAQDLILNSSKKQSHCRVICFPNLAFTGSATVFFVIWLLVFRV
jgi:hypothetical protein